MRQQSSLSVKTIGVYGTTEKSFFGALAKAKVDTFCDIRRRRAVRGSKYTYANANRLQRKLKNMGIKYVHIKELAPSAELLMIQRADDKAKRLSPSHRTTLAKAFAQRYKKENLKGFNLKKFLDKLPADTHVVCLFCGEREPAACHRSLVAKALQRDLKTKTEHLRVHH